MSARIEVFVFLDALGWDIVGPTGYLKDVLPYRRSVEMQFGYSCTAIPTILSGKRPVEHEHLSLFRFAPNDSPFGATVATDDMGNAHQCASFSEDVEWANRREGFRRRYCPTALVEHSHNYTDRQLEIGRAHV